MPGAARSGARTTRAGTRSSRRVSRPPSRNPAQQLDFARFSSDELLACYTRRAGGARRAQSRHAGHDQLHGAVPAGGPVPLVGRARRRVRGQLPGPGRRRGARGLGHGLRPDPVGGRRAAVAADGAGAKRGQLAGGQRAEGAGAVPRRSACRRSPAAADAVLSFQWRAAATGAEKFHSGMVPHAGTDSRVWREVVSLGADLRRLAPVAGRPVRAEAALLLDWESWWALELDSHPSSRLRLADLLGEFYRPLFEAGVNVDFAHPESDLSRYRLVVVPALYLVSDAGADNVRRFVADGGTALITLLLRDRRPQRPGAPRRLPGALARPARPAGGGAGAAARGPGRPAEGASTRRVTGRAAGRLWQDVIDLRGADPAALVRRRSSRAARRRRPGTTTARARRSTSARCRTAPTLRRLVGQACRHAGVELRADLPRGVEAGPPRRVPVPDQPPRPSGRARPRRQAARPADRGHGGTARRARPARRPGAPRRPGPGRT